MKLFRILISISIVLLIVIFSLLIALVVNNVSEGISSKLSSEYNSCRIEKPSRAIILRLDDVGNTRLAASKIITNSILENGFKVSLGVIPSRLDLKTMLWLRSLDSNTEIIMHGYEHTDYEFETLNKDEAKEKLESGRKSIYYKTGYITSTFIPPNNKYSAGTSEALNELGFKIISSGENELNFNDDMALLGYDTHTNNIDTNKILNTCKSSLNTGGVCTILIHPQDFFDYNGNVDINKYNQFLILLDSLNNLNAAPKTFKDLLNC